MDTKDADWKILQENNESEGGGDMNECAFFYESNEAALKGNADYQQLLTTIVMLESQRSQAVKDLDTLLEIQQKASSDPVDFVSKLQYKVDMGIPKPQKIAELPYISWGQYIYNMKDIFNSYGSKQFTRLKNKSDPLGNIKDGWFI